MLSKLKYVAFAAAIAITPVVASAATLIENGLSYTVGRAETEFFGNVLTAGGAGSWTATFNADTDPVNAEASASIRRIQLGQFSGLTMSWYDAMGGLLSSTAVVIGDTFLSTVFTAPNLTQNLVLSWTNSKEAQALT